MNYYTTNKSWILILKIAGTPKPDLNLNFTLYLVSCLTTHAPLFSPSCSVRFSTSTFTKSFLNIISWCFFWLHFEPQILRLLNPPRDHFWSIPALPGPARVSPVPTGAPVLIPISSILLTSLFLLHNYVV